MLEVLPRYHQKNLKVFALGRGIGAEKRLTA